LPFLTQEDKAPPRVNDWSKPLPVDILEKRHYLKAGEKEPTDEELDAFHERVLQVPQERNKHTFVATYFIVTGKNLGLCRTSKRY
jgi:hypothetical protein